MKTSANISTIAKALRAFQEELRDPAKTAINPAFKSKYIPLDDIILAIRPTANKHGLVFQQEVGGDGTNISVSTRVSHESGEWMETEPLVVHADQTSIQKSMSAITYSKRYSLSAFVLLASGDPDDDGNEADGKKKDIYKDTKAKRELVDPDKWPESVLTAYTFETPKFHSLTVRKAYESEDGDKWLKAIADDETASEVDRAAASRAMFILALSK